MCLRYSYVGVFLCICAAFLMGCWKPSKVVLSVDTHSIPLRQKVGLGTNARSVYLKIPARAAAARQFLFHFQGKASLRIVHEESEQYLSLAAVPGVPITAEHHAFESALKGIHIDAAQHFRLFHIEEVDEALEGVSYEDGILYRGKLWKDLRSQDGMWHIEFPSPREEGILELRSKEQGGAGHIVLRQAGKEDWLRHFKNTSAEYGLYFHDLSQLKELSLQLEEGSTLQRLHYLPYSDLQYSSTAFLPAIPADMGAMLDRGAPQWRHPHFELYSWNLYPDILVIMSKDYATQARFFKRMAFYVEKRGFQGRILSDAELSHRHGWNAHNYHPEDLARFFNVADEALLSDEEILLRDLLVAEEIIIPHKGNYTAGTGGILATSLQSPARLRFQLLGHEMLHGLYYMHEGFRTEVSRVWNNLDNELQDFWRFFLSTLSYEGTDTALVMNEFQAYLLQNGQDEVRNYYSAYEATLIHYRPSFAAYVQDFYRRRFEDFIAPSSILHRYVKNTMGMDVPDFRMLDSSP